MNATLVNVLILLVNAGVLWWSIRSWKRTVREKWMNNLRDVGAELIGAAERVHMERANNNLTPEALSRYLACEHKLILLFAHSEKERKKFTEYSESLRNAADSINTGEYRNGLNKFSKIINDRVLQEWNSITTFYQYDC